MDSVAGEMYNLCDLALRRLGTLTSELYLDEYTYLDLLLGVRLFLSHFLIVTTQMGDWDIGLLEEIAAGFQRPYRESPVRRERVVTVFPGGRWGEVFRVPNQAPRLRAAIDVRFGSVGGWYHEGFKVSELDVA